MLNKYSIKFKSWSDEEKYYVVCSDAATAVAIFVQDWRLSYLPEEMVIDLVEVDVEIKKTCHAVIDYTKFLEILPMFMPHETADSLIGTMEDNDIFIRFFEKQ